MNLTFETVNMPFVLDEVGTEARLAVMGESVGPGLAIVPMIAAEESGRVFFLGGFQLVHTATGRHLGSTQIVTCLGCVTRFAEAMVATGIDWTKNEGIAEQVKNDTALASAIGEASIELLSCDEAECAYSCSLGDPEPVVTS
jgi:hypothetical protein